MQAAPKSSSSLVSYYRPLLEDVNLFATSHRFLRADLLDGPMNH